MEVPPTTIRIRYDEDDTIYFPFYFRASSHILTAFTPVYISNQTFIKSSMNSQK